MRITGCVQGEYARRYSGFTYRLPIVAPVDIWTVDPDRLHPTQEYPRFVSKPCEPAMRTVDRADFEIVVSAPDPTGWRQAELWMLPHKTYTDAKTRQLVFSVAVGGVDWTASSLEDFVMTRAFSAERRVTRALEQKP